MTALIICTSVSHGNTLRVAHRIGDVLGARILAPGDVTDDALDDADLVGFGSGIFNLGFHRDLRRCVAALAERPRGAAFVFATSGFPEPPFRRYTRGMERLIASRGFRPVGTFQCRGHDTVAPLKLVGGIHRSRPNEDDLRAAERFAATLRA